MVTVAGNIFLGILQNAIVMCMKSPDSRTVGRITIADYSDYGDLDDIESKPVRDLQSPAHAPHAVLAHAQQCAANVCGNKRLARLDRVRVIVAKYVSKCICVVLPSIGISLQTSALKGDKNKNSKKDISGTKNKAGAVFGISATADRAARVIAPLIGGMLIQHYGSAGLAGLGCASVLYCLVLLLWKAPQQANILTIPVTHVYNHRKTM